MTSRNSMTFIQLPKNPRQGSDEGRLWSHVSGPGCVVSCGIWTHPSQIAWTIPPKGIHVRQPAAAPERTHFWALLLRRQKCLRGKWGPRKWWVGDPVVGVGSPGWSPEAPSLRTVRAVFPHTALRLVVLPQSGLASHLRSCFQGEEPLFGKESVGPAVVVSASSSAFPFGTVTQDTA